MYLTEHICKYLLVAPDIVELGHDEEEGTPHGEPNEDLVTRAVVWLVLGTVNLRRSVIDWKNGLLLCSHYFR